MKAVKEWIKARHHPALQDACQNLSSAQAVQDCPHTVCKGEDELLSLDMIK